MRVASPPVRPCLGLHTGWCPVLAVKQGYQYRCPPPVSAPHCPAAACTSHHCPHCSPSPHKDPGPCHSTSRPLHSRSFSRKPLPSGSQSPITPARGPWCARPAGLGPVWAGACAVRVCMAPSRLPASICSVKGPSAVRSPGMKKLGVQTRRGQTDSIQRQTPVHRGTPARQWEATRGMGGDKLCV